MKNPKINESLIIGVDFFKRDDGVLIVGRQKNGDVTIINAFQGKEAFDIYKKLITVKKGGGNNKNSLGYKVGQALAFVIGVCIAAILVALTVKLILWIL